MIQLIYSAKRSVHAVLFALLLITGMCAGCASDNIHMPDPNDESSRPDPSLTEKFDGTLTTSLPEMPTFQPVRNDDYVRLTWSDAHRQHADIELGAFAITVEQMNMHFNIGTMLVKDVVCTEQSDGSYVLEKAEFECQAGEYFTRGSLTGRYDHGNIELTLLYKPGSMPFQCQSVFTMTSPVKPVVCQGKLTTSLPEMPSFSPVSADDYARLSWNGADRKSADIELGAFDITVEQMNMHISIGTMLIKDVKCEDNGDGTYSLVKEAFECQAGTYFTTGSLSGIYKPGSLDFTLLYKPGSMPFQCRSEFTGSSDEELN